MGLLEKTKSIKTVADNETFTKDELQFLLTKLRTADYKGSEFERFYNIYVKLQNLLDNKK